jgi:predicted nuclease of restriction endonuclease-like (RecB) superfamily
MVRGLSIPQDYARTLEQIKKRIRAAQYDALKAVNREQIALYWDIGRIIVDRQREPSWGKAVVERLAADLRREFPGVSGFSASNLWRMRGFFMTYSGNEELAPMVREIGWTHNICARGCGRGTQKGRHMEMKYFLTCMAAFVLVAVAFPVTGLTQESVPGGYATTSVTNREVVAAAAFAIKAQEKAGGETASLKLVEILGAESQVVAGVNYRLQLKVKLNGKERAAEAIVWWQAWRKPGPYQLTSWNWK